MTEGGVAAVDRALSILSAFTEKDHSLSLATLAERTGLYKSTISRLISSLERFDHIARLEDGSYQLGPQMGRLGAIYRRQFRTHDHVPPVLRKIVAEINESASFYIANGTNRTCLHRAEAERAIRDHVNEGDDLPLDVGSAGHVLRAYLDDDDPKRSRFLKSVRDTYYSASFGERDPETAAIAVPVFSHLGLKGALSVSGPRYRLERTDIEFMVTTLWRYAQELTTIFGGDPNLYPETFTRQRKSAS